MGNGTDHVKDKVEEIKDAVKANVGTFSLSTILLSLGGTIILLSVVYFVRRRRFA